MRWVFLFFIFLIGLSCNKTLKEKEDKQSVLLQRSSKNITRDSLLLLKWEGRCNSIINSEDLYKYFKNEERTFWDSVSKPDYWTDSEYCDHVYWQIHMQLKNPDFLEFNDVLPESCLNWVLQELKVKSVKDLENFYSFFHEFIKRTDLWEFPDIQIVGPDLLKGLILKYGKYPDKAIDFSKEKDGRKYTAVCYYFMNGSIVEEMGKKLADPRFLFFCFTDPHSSTEPFDLFIEYEFVKTKQGFRAHRKILNPYVFNEFVMI